MSRIDKAITGLVLITSFDSSPDCILVKDKQRIDIEFSCFLDIEYKFLSVIILGLLLVFTYIGKFYRYVCVI